MLARLDQLLTRYRIEHELRTSSAEEVAFEIRWPTARKTDRLSNEILHLYGENATGVEWEEKKDKA